MSVINAERSRSSNGRGGNTQQEPHRLVKSDLSQIAVWTAHRRMTACAKIEQKNQRHISESIAIDIVLGDALTTYSRKLAEKKIVQIIRGYLTNDISERIRRDIRNLEEKLEISQDRDFHWMMLNKTLDSKHKQLLDQQGTPNGTPESSDDEDGEDPMYEDYTLEVGRLPKVNDTINQVETPKTNKKNKKADQFAPDEEMASYISTRKNQKTLKNPKDEEDAEPRRIQEAQRKDEETEKTKPAAVMSTPYCHQPAAEVLNTDHHNHAPDTPTISLSKIKSTSNLTRNDLGTNLVLGRNGKTLEKSSSSASRLVANDSLESQAAVPVDNEMNSDSIPQNTLDEEDGDRKLNKDKNKCDKKDRMEGIRLESERSGTRPVQYTLQRADENEEETEESGQDEEEDDEWCEWGSPWPSKDSQVTPTRHTLTASRIEGRLKGGTKTSTAAKMKIKEKLDELANWTMKTERFKSAQRSRRSKNRPEGMHEVGWRKGLVNLKNTCYLNAAMQGLVGCSILREAIIRAPEWDWKQSRLTRRMKVMFLEMIKPDRQQPWAPEEMFKEICTWKKCVGYRNKTQQDAGELIRCMIERLSEENKTVGKLFLADQANITICSNCSEETVVEQKFNTLALNIEDNTMDRRENKETRDKSIEGLVERYISREKLTKGNENKCNACGKRQVPDRQTQFVYGPNVLIMQLKRFTKREEHGRMITTKLNTKVHFHEELSLPCQLSSIGLTANYQLKAVTEHRSQSAGNGHYATYALDGNQWYEWNDEVGKPVTWETVQKAEAYILFWERKFEEGAQVYEEWERSEVEDVTEGEGEEGTMTANKDGAGDIKMLMEIEEDRPRKVVPIIAKKRRLEPYENSICEKLKLERKVTVKRHKRNGEELNEEKQANLGTTERDGKWRWKPNGSQKPEAWNAGQTPTAGDFNEGCQEGEMEEEPNLKENCEANKLEAISQLLGTAMNEIKELKQIVEQQNLEISRLKLNLSTLKAKVNVRMSSEDEGRYQDEETYIKNLPRNSTPVGRTATDKIQHPSHVRNPTPRSMSRTRNRQREENGAWMEQNQYKKNPESHSEREHEMEVEYAESHRNLRPTPVIERRQQRKWKNQKYSQEEYLEECFRKQIGMPTQGPQRINIYNFKNKKVATGYQRVVTTCQGMYFEMTKQQVEWGNLKDRGVTIGGDYRWGTEGITVYKPIKEMPTSTVVRHRFAMLPPKGTYRRRLKTDRYYIHVYQTKIGDQRKTLQSRKMAQELRRRYREYYYPREVDKYKQERGWRENEPTQSRVNGRNKSWWWQDEERVKMEKARKSEEMNYRAQTRERNMKPREERMDKNEGQGRFTNRAPRTNGTKREKTNAQMKAFVRKLKTMTTEFLEGTF